MTPADCAAAVSAVSAHYDLLILANGVVKVLIWASGSALAFWRRRWGVALGFGLASLLSLARASADAQLADGVGHIPLLAYVATPVAGLIVASFFAHQPAGAPRPGAWTP